jgi:ubiquinone/menaquinone biosynthesis C-methylase UbiE
MYLLENSHFWFVGKRFFIKTYLDPIKRNTHNILDIGSGTGGATKFLEKYGKVTGIEKNNYAISLAKKRGLKIIKGEAEKLPFKNNNFDLVTIFDVLYHKDVKDVKKAILEIKRVLKQNGYILIADSALNFLKGNHSHSTYEKRRFTAGELVNVLRNNGFVTIKHSYIYFSIFPLVLLKRIFIDKFFKSKDSDVFSVPKVINLLLIFLLKLESLLLNYVKLPIGSSMVILSVKK